MKEVKIVDIKLASQENAEKLFSTDGKYFYWTSRKLLKNKPGDIVFIINRHARWALYAKIDKLISAVSYGEQSGITTLSDLGQSYPIIDTKGWYKSFTRFTIIEKAAIPEGWNWSTPLRQSQTYDLVKEGLDDHPKRLQKVDDLEKIFLHGESAGALEEVREFLTASKQLPKSGIDRDVLVAVKTKPFILLAGISGTGKSRLVRTLAFQTCTKDLQTTTGKPGNFELIPVRPNWHDSSELMGYISRINGEKYIVTDFLKFIAKAWKHADVPFFLCLDEMNLAPVEQYFAEYLSILETRRLENGRIVSDCILDQAGFDTPDLYRQVLTDLGLDEDEQFKDGIGIPPNLIVCGTVNMDETTHSFSRKVLDRAMTFEMNDVDLGYGLESVQNDWSYTAAIDTKYALSEFTAGKEVYPLYKQSTEVIAFLRKLNGILEGTAFKIAYRVRDEFLIYCYHSGKLSESSNWLIHAFDQMVSMKILSRIEGDQSRTEKVLKELSGLLTEAYPKSHSKLKEMQHRLASNGYTSFWS